MSTIGAIGGIILVCAVFLSAARVDAQVTSSETRAANSGSPVDDFSKAYKALKDALADLPKKIDETNRLVQNNTDPASAHKQLESLRSIVSSVLGLVADNGTVAILGQAAVTHARRKLNDLRQDTRFTKEQKEQLVSEWQRVTKETENALLDLDTARKELAELLRIVQSNEDFLAELEALNQAYKAIEVIKNLTINLRDISIRLRDLIQNKMKVPSM